MFSLFKQAQQAQPALPPAVPTIKQPEPFRPHSLTTPNYSKTYDSLVKTPYDYWTTGWNKNDPSWKGKIVRDFPVYGANAQADKNIGGLVQWGDDGKAKLDFNAGKITNWLQTKGKGLLPYGAGLLGVGMLAHAIGKIGNRPATQVNVSYPSAIPGMNQRTPHLPQQGTLFPNEQ